MLLAQNAVETPQGFSVVFLLAILVPLVLLALTAAGIVWLLRHLRFNREKLHEERLRMIEMGYPLEDSESSKRQGKVMHNAFWISFWMVVAVPGAAFSAAATASDRVEVSVGMLLAIWIGASATSVAAVICAAVLMICSRSQSNDENELAVPKKS